MTTEERTNPGGEIAHSSLVGGSTASRRINCPASYQMEQKVPEWAKNKSSPYADEGSALHDCIAYILDNDIVDIDEVRGMEFRGYVITDEMMADAIRPAVDLLDKLMEEAERRGEGNMTFMVEKRCEFPGIDGAYGTSDLIFRTEKRSGILDWKFGAGVPVAAIMPDPEGDILNAQLCFYARAAQHSYPGFFGVNDWPVEIIIFQPMLREDLAVPVVEDGNALASALGGTHGLSYAMTSVKELEEFRYQLIRAVAEAKGQEPTMRKGKHCKFAACKAICPLWTGPALDLTKLTDRKAAIEKGKGVPAGVDVWGDFYAAALDAKEQVDQFFDEIAKQAHQRLESGLPVPGWKLVPSRPTAKYIDEAGAARHAIGLGVPEEEVYEPPKIKSPAKLRDLIEPLMEGGSKKERKEKAQEQVDQFAPRVSSGTTLAREGDARHGVSTPGAAIEALGQKLAAITSR